MYGTCNKERRTKRSPSSSSSDSSINCLKNLSNELVYGVFDYLTIDEIFYAFSNLNNRFQNLISCSTFPLKIKLDSKSRSTLGRHYQLFIDNVKSSYVNVQFTHLHINSKVIPLKALPDIIPLLPKLHRLEIFALSNRR